MRKIITVFIFTISCYAAFAQSVPRPKLVVGLVVDQMRWDYLYRYYDRYAPNGGFRRLLNKGFSCENTFIPYTPTITACGHSSIYTGSVPAISGITGNFWWDNDQHRQVYCTEDKSVTTVGSSSALGLMSPRNMLVTSICDELRLATNFRSKVIGVAIKDRGSILPAGHSANGAYWYDNTNGNWITSTYYNNELPKWVEDFNSKKLVDQYYAQGWKTLYPINTYKQSSADEEPWESKPIPGMKGFPYDTKGFVGKNYGIIANMPQGNTLTAEIAKAAITGEKLGADDTTDFLTISFSAPDYIGHNFGPNSVEEEDNYLRLDQTFGDLFDFLDKKVGVGQYLVFLSADHGVAHVPGFLKEHKLPAATIDLGDLIRKLNTSLKNKYGIATLINSQDNYQLYLNHPAIDSAKINLAEVKKFLIDSLATVPEIYRVFAIDKLSETTLNEKQKDMLANGYYPRRSGDIQIMLLPGTIDFFINSGTTHGLWNPYDAHIPLVWYGWGVKQGKTNRETYMTDIAATLAALLHIQMPSGCVGKPIPEIMK